MLHQSRRPVPEGPKGSVRIERYLLVISVGLLAYVVFANYQDSGLALWDWDWLFISGFSTFIGALFVARSLSRKLDTLLLRLADRGALVACAEPGTVLRRDAQPIKALRRMIAELEDLTTQIVGGVVGAILLLACIVAFGQFGIGDVLRHTGLIVIATAGGYLAGRHIGQMIAYGYLGWLMGKANIVIEAKPGHIDGAAGLKPVGSFYFFQAMLLAIPGLFLGIWWFLIPLWPGLGYSHWRDAYLGLLLVVVVFEIAAFVAPMWRFHTIMAESRVWATGSGASVSSNRTTMWPALRD